MKQYMQKTNNFILELKTDHIKNNADFLSQMISFRELPILDKALLEEIIKEQKKYFFNLVLKI